MGFADYSRYDQNATVSRVVRIQARATTLRCLLVALGSYYQITV